MKAISTAAIVLCLSASVPAATTAAESFVLALVNDGPSRSGRDIEDTFRDEISALTEGELEVRFKSFEGDWTARGILGAMDRAYADPDVDMVLVTGMVANQIVGPLEHFPKPTFLPVVIDARVLGLPRSDGGSGKANLNYLTDDIDFSDNLENFLDVVEFKRLGLLVDGAVLEAVGRIASEVGKIASGHGVETVLVPFTETTDDLAALIPPDVEAVMVGGLARLSDADVERLIDGLIARRIPSFSFEGDGLVKRGLLTGDTPDSDWQRLARRIALNMQAVMLGERAEDQPVDFEAKRRLYLNLATAGAIDVWPPFDVLVEAVVVAEGLSDDGPYRTLTQVALEAVETNLDLLDQLYGTEAGAEDIREARATLLPQVSADLATTQLDGGSASVSSGAVAKRSTSGAFTVSQIVWSESARAALDIQRQVQRSREAELEAFRLDTVQAAVVAFLDLLRAETQFRVQRDNLELTRANLDLARDRVRVGSANASDVYRWDSQLATTRQSAIAAHFSRLRARENLNRVLHRPLTQTFRVAPADLDEPGLLIAGGEIAGLIDNPKAFRHMTELLVGVGLERSPELVSLRALVAARQRELESGRRAYYSPTVSLKGQVSQVLEEDRGLGLSLEGETDWSLGLVASLPLWSGGSRHSRVTRAELELAQLETRYESVRQQIEQNIRSNLHLVNASYVSIALAERAAEASGKNLELVTDSYSQGVVSIIDLLDAQSAALQADEAASNAVYTFLIDMMNVQRATGRFDFFLDEAEREATLQRLRTYIETEGHGDE